MTMIILLLPSPAPPRRILGREGRSGALHAAPAAGAPGGVVHEGAWHQQSLSKSEGFPEAYSDVVVQRFDDEVKIQSYPKAVFVRTDPVHDLVADSSDLCGLVRRSAEVEFPST